MVTHVPPSAPTWYSNAPRCTGGGGEGVPVAHIPVNELTVTGLTTTTLTGDYGAPTAVPVLTSITPPTTAKSATTSVLDTSTQSTDPVATSAAASQLPPAITESLPTVITATPTVPPMLSSVEEVPMITRDPTIPPEISSAEKTSIIIMTDSSSPSSPESVFVITQISAGFGDEAPQVTASDAIESSSLPSEFVIGSQTVLIEGSATQVVVGDSTYSLNSASVFVIGSQTVTPGIVVTHSAQADTHIPGGSSNRVSDNTQTSTNALGDIIVSQGGFSTPKPPAYTGPLASKAVLGFWIDVRIMETMLMIVLISVWAL